MPHACSQCGATVDQGVAFCPKCNAPQIRVSPGSTETDAPDLPGTPTSRQLSSNVSPQFSTGNQPVDWPFARSRSVIAAGAMVLLMLYPPVSRLFFLWMPLCGALPVLLYRRRRPLSTLSAGAGARMGATAGVFTFAILVAMMAVGVALERYVFHGSAQLVAQLRSQVQQVVASNADPQVRQMAQYLTTPDGLALLLIASMLFLLALFLVLCGLGGLAAGALSGRNGKTQS